MTLKNEKIFKLALIKIYIVLTHFYIFYLLFLKLDTHFL